MRAMPQTEWKWHQKGIHDHPNFLQNIHWTLPAQYKGGVVVISTNMVYLPRYAILRQYVAILRKGRTLSTS